MEPAIGGFLGTTFNTEMWPKETEAELEGKKIKLSSKVVCHTFCTKGRQTQQRLPSQVFCLQRTLCQREYHPEVKCGENSNKEIACLKKSLNLQGVFFLFF